MTLTRRQMLRNSALTGLALTAGSALGGLPFADAASAAPAGSPGYGPLQPDPAGALSLPRGFKYRVLGRGGNGYATGFTTYADGQKLAGDADAGASFALGRNRTALVVNHEISTGASELAQRVPATFDGTAVPSYDAAAGGGTSTFVIGPNDRVERVYPSLTGTLNNCAGGLTPWGTWLTCEETESTLAGTPHGYVFEVDPEGALTTGQPHKAMGRFIHEAVAIDPATSIAYLTEDNTTGLLYRFVPSDTSMEYGSLGNGGQLSAMKAQGIARLGQVSTVGTTLPITWTSIANPDQVGLRNTLSNDQVTRSTKLEGCWFADGTFYFVSSFETVAGVEHNGQVWALEPAAQTITLVAHIPVSHPTFDSPDNMTVMPSGQILLCEDGDGEQYLVGVDPATGELWPFARNLLEGENEFAGANFSPDGKTLFVNVQNPSTTFAITGPWGAVRNGQ